jgi:hypothetical protein
MLMILGVGASLSWFCHEDRIENETTILKFLVRLPTQEL